MTDPIADMLSRIRNAITAKHKTVDVPYSGLKKEIARVLNEEGYVKNYSVVEEGIKKTIRLELKYAEGNEAIIKEILRVSKPGRRIYINKKNIPRVKGGIGISILSTSKGIMAGTKARVMGIGGEILCTIL